MTVLQVRKPAWVFDETIPFLWNPENPQFTLAMNGLSFIAPGFERFIVAATRAALAEITDPAVREEADLFLRQEAVHARAHRSHVTALIAKYPGLQRTLTEIERRFDALQELPLRFQLAYVADIEATFTPMFDLTLRHRDVLFDNGDHRVAPLFLWHLVEEIEHRSSAQIVYDAVVPSSWYRLRMTPRVFAHMLGCFHEFCRGVDAHVPFADRGIDASEMIVDRDSFRSLLRRSDVPPQFPGVPRGEIAMMIYRLARSQMPGHSPATERTPPFASDWLAAYDAGRDVMHWYDSSTASLEGGTIT